MKRWAALAAVVAFVTGPVAGRASGAPDGANDTTWIVTLVAGADPAAEAPGLARAYGGEASHVYANVLGGFSFAGSDEAAAALARNPRVERVDPALPVHLTELAPNGILRIDAWAAHQAGYVGKTAGGAKVRVAVVDSGIRASHSDLAPNVVAAEGKNCVAGGPPDDDVGHGTHVAGTAAAAYNGGDGVVGVATDARLTAIKVVDSTGYGTDAQVICGIDHAVGLARTTGVPTVINLSLGEARSEGTGCASAPLHQAICDATAAGVTVVAAAGNDGADAANFYPAAYPEVVAVSALTDYDGTRSFAGCDWEDTAGWECDDTLADFSNWGSVVDVAAPGVRVYSTDMGGGWSIKSGTSMAAPHVAGVAALLLGANPSLTPGQVRLRLMSSGECPDGTVASTLGSCAGHGQWEVGSLFGNYPDPDGIAEPLVDALRAAQAAGSPPAADTTPPAVAVTSPAAGATVSGVVTVAATATDGSGVAKVEFLVDGVVKATDTSSPYSAAWDTATAANGGHTLTARATDTAGNAATSAPVDVTVANNATRTHVAALSSTGATAKKASWTAVANVAVVDQNGAAVSGATVTFALSGGANGTVSCTTGADGRCSASVSVPNKKTSVTFTVSGVAKAGTTYDAAADAASSTTATRP